MPNQDIAGLMAQAQGGTPSNLGGTPTPTKDPVKEALDKLQAALDSLVSALGQEEVVEAPQNEPQTDEEVMAGVTPQPKAQVKSGGVSPFPQR